MRLPLLLTVAATLAVLAAACSSSSSNSGTPTPSGTPYPLPVLSAVLPTSGQVGTVLTASGTGFGSNPDVVSVTVAGAQATVVTVSGGTVTFVVPEEAFPGTRDVQV